MNRGGRGGNMGGNRGMGMNRGRGGMFNSGSGRGGTTPTGPLRSHQSRDRGGFGNFNRRGGGSFTSGQHHHQGSFRGGHGNRNMGGHGNRGRDSFHHNQNRGSSNAGNTTSTSGSSKREENRRTLTDFKIIGLELKDLDWQWGVIPGSAEAGSTEATKANEEDSATDKVKKEDADMDLQNSSEVKQEPESETHDENAAVEHKKEASVAVSSSQGAFMARMRIYFHTPPNADDARPILPVGPASDSRKGKRKKLDDDDGDGEEERRAPPPPPLPSGADGAESDTTKAPASIADGDTSVGRGSVAPSVATEAASEADWLMAAIAEGDGDADAEGEVDAYEETQLEIGDLIHDQDGELLRVHLC